MEGVFFPLTQPLCRKQAKLKSIYERKNMTQTISQKANCATIEKKKYSLPPTFRKPTQAERHAPKYLTENQVDHLIEVAQTYGKNDWIRKRNTLLLMMLFRHGLRRTEARNLRWNQILTLKIAKFISQELRMAN